jgi:hypothetical protein
MKKKIPNDEMSGKGEIQSYTIYYPSGQVLNLAGVFSFIASPDPNVGAGPAIRTEKKEVVVLDPRALVTRAAGIVYTPRENKNLAKSMREWLDVHPEWPPNIT